jgi:hypothetical protein
MILCFYDVQSRGRISFPGVARFHNHHLTNLLRDLEGLMRNAGHYLPSHLQLWTNHVNIVNKSRRIIPLYASNECRSIILVQHPSVINH